MKFSIRFLFAVIALVALLAAIWAHAESWIWRSVAFSTLWTMLLGGVLGAVLWRGEPRAFCLGLVLFGSTYIALASVPDARWFNQGLYNSRPVGHAVAMQLSEYIDRERGQADGPSAKMMEVVLNTYAAMLSAIFGGCLGVAFYRVGGAKAQSEVAPIAEYPKARVNGD